MHDSMLLPARCGRPDPGLGGWSRSPRFLRGGSGIRGWNHSGSPL